MRSSFPPPDDIKYKPPSAEELMHTAVDGETPVSLGGYDVALQGDQPDSGHTLHLPGVYDLVE